MRGNLPAQDPRANLKPGKLTEIAAPGHVDRVAECRANPPAAGSELNATEALASGTPRADSESLAPGPGGRPQAHIISDHDDHSHGRDG
jgi:hypothetical protein